MATEVKGLIFDMDGLMFDTERLYEKASLETAKKMGLPVDKEFESQFPGAGDEYRSKKYHEKFDEKFGKDYVTNFLNRSEEKMQEYFLSGDIDVKDGLINLLHQAQLNGVKCIIASSNNGRTIERLIKQKNLQDMFIGAISGDDVEVAKPNPEIFNKAVEALGLTKEECLVLEDSTNGILAANNAGIRVIMIPDTIQPTAETEEKVWAITPTLNEVANYL